MQLEPISILIVDDEESIRIVLEEILTEAGFTCAAFGDAIQGLAYLNEHSVDVVISDIVLPQMHGTEFALRIRQIRPDIEIILITGLPDTQTAIEGIRARVFDYVIKPFTPDMIRSRVNRAVDIVRLRRENWRYREHLEQLVDERTRELERLTANIIGMQEAQIRHLSREVHDDIGQSLLALKLDLQSKAGMMPEEQAVHLASSISYLNTIIDSCRDLSHRLSPASLTRLGVHHAIQDLLAMTAEKAGIKARCDLEALEEWGPEPYATNLYRIVQEAVTNACKHSHCTELRISAVAQKDNLRLEIQDNGEGFAESADAQGIGLMLMRERAELLRGRLTVESGPGGTLIYVDFPKHPHHNGR